MKKIFAYTKTERLSKAIIAELLKAGYIPVPVDSFDNIRVIEPMPDISLAETSIIFSSALETLAGSDSWSDVKKIFATTLIKKTRAKLEAADAKSA